MFKVYFARFALRLFHLFPVNKRKIFFSSYEGGPISCNPKYIYRELRKRYGDRLTYVWEWNRPGEHQPDSEGVIFVRHNSLRYIFHVMTAKVLISNTGVSAVFPLRRGQFSVNTWHGAGCYKKAGKDYAGTNAPDYPKRRKFAEKNVDCYLSGCREWTRVFSQAVCSDPKKFLPIGSPRIDMFIHGVGEERIRAIRERIGVQKRFVLYAPTYRGDRERPAAAACPLDVPELLRALEERFGGEWVFAYRCHYATASLFERMENAVDLSRYDDMQELLLVSDALISDYSSSVWDYSFTGKPCFLYCYDLNQYMDERDFYMPIRNWGFPVSENMEELLSQIHDFSFDSFRRNMAKHHEDLGSYETGTASAKASDIIALQLGFNMEV